MCLTYRPVLPFGLGNTKQLSLNYSLTLENGSVLYQTCICRFSGSTEDIQNRESKFTGLGMAGIERQLLSKGAESFVSPCFLCHFIVRTLRTENILVVIPTTHRSTSFVAESNHSYSHPPLPHISDPSPLSFLCGGMAQCMRILSVQA